MRDAARDYCQGRLAPRVLEAFRAEHTDPTIFREMGEIGLLGATIAFVLSRRTDFTAAPEIQEKA